jgi:hypothetical protein
VDRLRLGYLSGAPRVSTPPEALASGPRAHVLGVISGFRGRKRIYPTFRTPSLQEVIALCLQQTHRGLVMGGRLR